MLGNNFAQKSIHGIRKHSSKYTTSITANATATFVMDFGLRVLELNKINKIQSNLLV